MKKNNLLAIADGKEGSVESNIEEVKTDKKILKRAEKVVRRLDNALNELHSVSRDALELHESNTADATEKDMDRFHEMQSVICSTCDVLYHLTARMSRKYVGKEIEPIGSMNKRKPLKA